MEIKLSETWSIQKDQYNWILMKNRVVEDKNSKNVGTAYLQPVGYFSSISDLLRSAIERGMSDPDLRTIVDVKQYLDKTCTEIKETILKLKEPNATK